MQVCDQGSIHSDDGVRGDRAHEGELPAEDRLDHAQTVYDTRADRADAILRFGSLSVCEGALRTLCVEHAALICGSLLEAAAEFPSAREGATEGRHQAGCSEMPVQSRGQRGDRRRTETHECV